jgi:hypothetical protein
LAEAVGVREPPRESSSMRKTTMWFAAGALAVLTVGFFGLPASEAG